MFKNGDILFCSGTSGISEQIKKFTNSIYSHVGLIFNHTVNGSRVTYVIEAIQPCISIIPIDQYFNNYKQSGKPYPGKLFVGRLATGLNIEQTDQIFQTAISCVGKGYDSESIVKQALNKVLGLDLHDSNSHRLICSELVGLAYSKAGFNLKRDSHAYFTPASISLTDGIDIQPIV